MATNLPISGLLQRTLPLPSGSQGNEIDILDVTDTTDMWSSTGTNKRMALADLFFGYIATANSNLVITETATNSQPGILLTVPTTGLVITQHSGVIAAPSVSGGSGSIAVESTGGTGSAGGTGSSVTLASALNVTGSDLIYGCVSTGSIGPTISSAPGFNIRTNLNYDGFGESIGNIDALNITSNVNPALVLAASDPWSFVGIAFKAPSATNWSHNWSGSFQSTTSSTQTPLVVTAGGPVAIGDLIVVTVGYSYSGTTISVSDGTNTYSNPIVYPGGAVGESVFYYIATAKVSSGYTITATLSGTSFWSSMVVDDYSPGYPGALTINWAYSDWFIPASLPGLSGSVTTITFSNVTVGQGINLILTQGTGGQQVSWPSGISGGSMWPPSLSTGAGLRDHLFIKCVALNTYFGYIIMQGF